MSILTDFENMAEIYVKSKAYDGKAFCVVGIKEGDKSIVFHDIAFDGSIRMRDEQIPIKGVEANFQIMLYGVVWGLHLTNDKEADIFIHSGVVASWINGDGRPPERYGALMGRLRQQLIGRKAVAWQVDYGAHRTMNHMLDRLINLVKRKKYA